ncbi:MAG: hypothetical protein J6S41_03135, partial [Clostridia bacterium]|nr:hypothetical protein [Clostridia bacterium]
SRSVRERLKCSGESRTKNKLRRAAKNNSLPQLVMPGTFAAKAAGKRQTGSPASKSDGTESDYFLIPSFSMIAR